MDFSKLKSVGAVEGDEGRIQSRSIAEAELELALSKMRLNKKKNPRKIIEEIASCKVSLAFLSVIARTLCSSFVSEESNMGQPFL